MTRTLTTLLCLGIATAALAHTDVKNPAVKARMDGMTRLAAHTKALATGMKNGAPQADIAAAAAAMRQEAATVASLFQPLEDDPKSEARAVIWTDWSDFVARSQALMDAADMAERAQTPAEQGAAFRDIGAACAACHKVYRD
jgi:cytochrome c556